MPKRAEPAEHSNETYNAIIATYKVMQRSIAEMLSAEGLTQPQFHLLRIVARIGATPMKRISDEMVVTPANVTGIVDRLESKGLIRRTARAGDRRATIIELTPEGNMLQERMAVRYSEFMRSALRAFTNHQQGMLRDLLLKLQKEMSQERGQNRRHSSLKTVLIRPSKVSRREGDRR